MNSRPSQVTSAFLNVSKLGVVLSPGEILNLLTFKELSVCSILPSAQNTGISKNLLSSRVLWSGSQETNLYLCRCCGLCRERPPSTSMEKRYHSSAWLIKRLPKEETCSESQTDNCHCLLEKEHPDRKVAEGGCRQGAPQGNTAENPWKLKHRGWLG